ACSMAASDISRLTKSGTTCVGNTTTSRTGRTGITSGMSSSPAMVGGSEMGASIAETLPRARSDPEEARFFRAADDAARGQALDEEAPVALLRDARIEDGDDAPVGRAADEPAEALLEGQRGLRHLILEECVRTE